MIRTIRILCALLCFSLSVATPVSFANTAQKPSWIGGEGSKKIKDHLDKKSKEIFDVVIFTVVIIGGIAYAVAGGMLAYGRPQEARTLGISATAGLVLTGFVGALVSVFIG